MIEDPNGEQTSPDDDTLGNQADTAEKYRNPRATRKGPDMPEDHDGYRIDPDKDYERPDGTEHRGTGGA